MSPLVIDDFSLALGEFPKELIAFLRRDVLLCLCPSPLFEVVVDKLAEVRREVVVDRLRGGIVITHRQISVFARDMNLMNALFVEFIQRTVLPLSMAGAPVGQPTCPHGVVDDDKAAFNLHRPCLRQIERDFFDVGNRGSLPFLALKYRRPSCGHIPPRPFRFREVDELMGLKGYLRFGVYIETVGEMDATGPSEQFLIREFSLADENQSGEDDKHIYVPYVSAQEFWESLPSFVQMAVFTFGKGHSADELAALSKRIMLSAIHALPEIFVKLRDQIHDGSNSLLMCTLYYICFDHGLPRSAMALSKVSLGAKQISYIRESVKAVVEKLMETSVMNALDKKAEWTKQIRDVEDAELKQVMKNTLGNTKGKHGRRTFQQEEQSIDDILIADDKEALKTAILEALNNMEHEYETAYIEAALIRSHHLDPHISFSVFLRAISIFSGRECKYDPAQRVDSFILYEKKEFETSKSSKWQRGRRIVSYLTEVFGATPNTTNTP